MRLHRALVVVGAMDWAEGLSASLRAGFSSAPINARGVFVFLGDMPRIRTTGPAAVRGPHRRRQGGRAGVRAGAGATRC